MEQHTPQKAKRQSADSNYRYKKVIAGEMTPDEIDTLAKSVALFIFQRMQIMAIAEMQHCLPDDNPLNEPEFNLARFGINDKTKIKVYPHTMHVEIDIQRVNELRKHKYDNLSEREKELLRQLEEVKLKILRFPLQLMKESKQGEYSLTADDKQHLKELYEEEDSILDELRKGESNG